MKQSESNFNIKPLTKKNSYLYSKYNISSINFSQQNSHRILHPQSTTTENDNQSEMSLNKAKSIPDLTTFQSFNHNQNANTNIGSFSSAQNDLYQQQIQESEHQYKKQQKNQQQPYIQLTKNNNNNKIKSPQQSYNQNNNQRKSINQNFFLTDNTLQQQQLKLQTPTKKKQVSIHQHHQQQYQSSQQQQSDNVSPIFSQERIQQQKLFSQKSIIKTNLGNSPRFLNTEEQEEYFPSSKSHNPSQKHIPQLKIEGDFINNDTPRANFNIQIQSSDSLQYQQSQQEIKQNPNLDKKVQEKREKLKQNHLFKKHKPNNTTLTSRNSKTYKINFTTITIPGPPKQNTTQQHKTNRESTLIRDFNTTSKNNNNKNTATERTPKNKKSQHYFQSKNASNSNLLLLTRQKSQNNTAQNFFKSPQKKKINNLLQLYENSSDSENDQNLTKKEQLKLKQEKFKHEFDKKILNIKPESQQRQQKKVQLIKIEKDFKSELKRLLKIHMHEKTKQEIYEEQIMQISKTFHDLYQISEYHDHHFRMLSEIYTHQKKIDNTRKWKKYITSKDPMMQEALEQVYKNLENQQNSLKQKQDFAYFFNDFQKQYIHQYVKKLIEIIKNEDMPQLRIVKAFFHGGHASDYTHDTLEDLYKVVAQIFIDNNFKAPELKNLDIYNNIYENQRVQKLEEKMLKQGQFLQKTPVQGQNLPQNTLKLFKSKKEQKKIQHEQKVQQLLQKKSKLIEDFQKQQSQIKQSQSKNNNNTLNINVNNSNIKKESVIMQAISPSNKDKKELYQEQLYYQFKLQRQKSQQRLHPIKQQKTTNFFNSYEQNNEYQQIQSIINYSNQFLTTFQQDKELQEQKKLLKSMQQQPRKSNLQQLLEQQQKIAENQQQQDGSNKQSYAQSLMVSLNNSQDYDQYEIKKKQELKKVINCEDFKLIQHKAADYLKQNNIYQQKPNKKQQQQQKSKSSQQLQQSSSSSQQNEQQQQQNEEFDPFTLVIPKCKIYNTDQEQIRLLKQSQEQMAKNDKILEKLAKKSYQGFQITKQDVINKYNEHKKKLKQKFQLRQYQQEQQQQQQQQQEKQQQQQQQQQDMQNRTLSDS